MVQEANRPRRIIRVVGIGWMLVMWVVVGYGITQSARYSRDLVRIVRGEFRSLAVDSIDQKNIPTVAVRRLAGRVDTLRLAQKSALVFLFDDKCGACKDNMARWMDLIVDVRNRDRNLPIYAVSNDPLERQAAYWGNLSSAVQLSQPVRRLTQEFGTGRLPSTLVLRNGHVIAAYAGAVGPWRRGFLLRTLFN